jgi:hypothetical protein
VIRSPTVLAMYVLALIAGLRSAQPNPVMFWGQLGPVHHTIGDGTCLSLPRESKSMNHHASELRTCSAASSPLLKCSVFLLSNFDSPTLVCQQGCHVDRIGPDENQLDLAIAVCCELQRTFARKGRARTRCIWRGRTRTPLAVPACGS